MIINQKLLDCGPLRSFSIFLVCCRFALISELKINYADLAFSKFTNNFLIVKFYLDKNACAKSMTLAKALVTSTDWYPSGAEFTALKEFLFWKWTDFSWGLTQFTKANAVISHAIIYLSKVMSSVTGSENRSFSLLKIFRTS